MNIEPGTLIMTPSGQICEVIRTTDHADYNIEIKELDTGYTKRTDIMYFSPTQSFPKGYWTIIPPNATTDQIKALRSILNCDRV